MCAKSCKIFPATTVDITDYISVPVFMRQGVYHVMWSTFPINASSPDRSAKYSVNLVIKTSLNHTK